MSDDDNTNQPTTDNAGREEPITPPSNSGPVGKMPVYVPGQRRHSADYEAMLRAIIDGQLDNVEPINGSFGSLIRSMYNSKTEKPRDD